MHVEPLAFPLPSPSLLLHRRPGQRGGAPPKLLLPFPRSTTSPPQDRLRRAADCCAPLLQPEAAAHQEKLASNSTCCSPLPLSPGEVKDDACCLLFINVFTTLGIFHSSWGPLGRGGELITGTDGDPAGWLGARLHMILDGPVGSDEILINPRMIPVRPMGCCTGRGLELMKGWCGGVLAAAGCTCTVARRAGALIFSSATIGTASSGSIPRSSVWILPWRN
ncbi:hypothetical protein BRADI_1g45751v3 [Brachypodium distachyon]|uniref:Uncharacterized protein n=1 Tax=Brachypodium distachyon TaxID=15368 RepID=A0A2K2DPJ6_BRADI|nr:hypothetical protein BRADI_1g45751v3 [Brachypodium distachyon]